MPLLIRPAVPADDAPLLALFNETVHTVCAGDYTPAQLDAWAPPERPLADWQAVLRRAGTVLAAELDGQLAGFGSIHPDGYLDLLFVHRTCQGRGVAAALCGALAGLCPGKRLTVHVSRTARGFFLGQGWRLVEAQTAERRGQRLETFLMEKE